MAPRKEATRLTHFSEQPRWPRTPLPPSSPQSTSTTSSPVSPLLAPAPTPSAPATMNPAMNNLVISLAAMQGLSAPVHSASAPNAHRARAAVFPVPFGSLVCNIARVPSVNSGEEGAVRRPAGAHLRAHCVRRDPGRRPCGVLLRRATGACAPAGIACARYSCVWGTADPEEERPDGAQVWCVPLVLA